MYGMYCCCRPGLAQHTHDHHDAMRCDRPSDHDRPIYRSKSIPSVHRSIHLSQRPISRRPHHQRGVLRWLLASRARRFALLRSSLPSPCLQATRHAAAGHVSKHSPKQPTAPMVRVSKPDRLEVCCWDAPAFPRAIVRAIGCVRIAAASPDSTAPRLKARRQHTSERGANVGGSDGPAARVLRSVLVWMNWIGLECIRLGGNNAAKEASKERTDCLSRSNRSK